jgi:hypothetical protein
VLPRERRPTAHLEVAPLAAEPPDDGARPPVDVVDRAGIARRNKQVSVEAQPDGVDVEVVERRLLSSLGVGLRDCDVPERVPFEQHASGRDVDLLQPRVDQVAALLVEGEQGRIPGRDLELLVAREPVPGANESNLPVSGVHDHVVTAAAAELRVALPPRQHRPAAVALDAEVGDAEPLRVKPDDPAAAVDDQRTFLAHGLLRRDEDVAGGGAVGGSVDRDGRRLEVGPRGNSRTRDLSDSR